jgi:hypothetical protein
MSTSTNSTGITEEQRALLEEFMDVLKQAGVVAAVLLLKGGAVVKMEVPGKAHEGWLQDIASK